MKSRLLVFISASLILSGLLPGQQYDGVVVSEGKNPDEDNRIFMQGNVLTYKVDSTSTIELPKQIIYTVLGLSAKKRTNRLQTEVVISYVPDMKNYENTGIVENDSNLWVHPPRTGALSVLETCPFPYVKFPIVKGAKWSDQLSVGEQWSQGLWKGRMLFDITYKVTGKKKLEIDNIHFDCWLIDAQAKSEAGTSSLSMIYHEDEGFIEMDFTTLTQEKVLLKLESTISGTVFKNMNDYFAEKLTEKK